MEIRDWRNIEYSIILPERKINVLSGENAQGKTNFIEAIYYVSTLRSFRNAKIEHLIRWGTSSFFLSAKTETKDGALQFSVSGSNSGKKIFFDGIPVKKTEEYFGSFHVVVFTPEHINLIRGEPSYRRSFLDRIVFNVEGDHLAVVKRYNHILRERNIVLKRNQKKGVYHGEIMDVYDKQLSKYGALIVKRRIDFISDFEKALQDEYRCISGNEKRIEMEYKANGWNALCRTLEEYEYEIRSALIRRRQRDMQKGFSSIGPHQDDVEIKLDNLSARSTASQGEARTIVIAMKLAETTWIHQNRGFFPILLLDDMGSELDTERRERLFEIVKRQECQTFITTASLSILPEEMKTNQFLVLNGEVKRIEC